jgi:MFS family permease
MMFLVGLSYGAVISFIAIYAEEFGIGNIGPFYTSFAVCVLLSRLFAGRLVDRRGPDIVMIPGSRFFIAAMLLLSQADKLNSLYNCSCVYGLGYGIVQPTLQALAVKNVEPQRRGAANSTLMCGFDSGIGLGAVIWGVVADATSLGTMFGANVLPVIAAFILYGYYRKNAMEKAQTKTVSRL